MISQKKLKELSLDKTNSIIVCDYNNKFIDLDETKGVLRKVNLPNSPDMLYINDERKEIWFVEFKSSKEKNLNKTKEIKKLKKKIFAGLFLIYEIFCNESCKYKDYDKFYFVVYNKKEYLSYEDEVLDEFDENSLRSIEFDLEELKPQFIKDVFTENCDSLKELFNKRFKITFS